MDLSQKARVALKTAGVRFLGRRIPIAIGWDITNRCNLRCAYCRQYEVEEEEMDAPTVLRVAREMASAGVEVVTLSGGEPLVRDDLGPVVAALKAGGAYVRINTNGTLVSARWDVVRACDEVKVSLDGPADIHDAIRGSGVYDKAVAAVRAVRGAGLRASIGAVISALNVDRIEEIVRIAADLGVRVMFQPLSTVYTAGRADGLPLAEPEAYRRALDRLIAEKRRTDRVVNSIPALEYMRAFPDPPPIRCFAGKGIARIAADGTMVPCVTMRDRFRGKNLRDAPFLEAFRSIPDAACRTCCCSNTLDFNLLLKPDPRVSASFARRVGRTK